ncbi:SDR family [Fusarium heterosporum]|uniref:SDR family n=1 Tax=Fusarium heterosporum TaxID=42747 RepID=A0A8H5TRD4_FUSHE|nr:SDR family [Fusarium heterosporum]
MSATTSPSAGTWTRVRPMVGHRATEDTGGVECRYQNLAALAEYRNFSSEEHRLQDYRHLKIVSTAGPSSQQFRRMVSMNLPKTGKLALLRGKGVEVHVGPRTPSDENIWNLSVNLISQHSEYFKAACLWNTTGKLDLPDHDPIVFSLFVEWIYYTTYDSFMFESGPNIHAKCWVLADYLLCDGLKNYAMGRLFKQHIDAPTLFSSAVSSEDVQYVCGHTAVDSKLRQFYMDFVVDHFADTKMLRGATADWDEILQDDSQARCNVLNKMRYPSRIHPKGLREYLEVNETKKDSHLRVDVGLAGLSMREKENKTIDFNGNSDLGLTGIECQSSVETAPILLSVSPDVNLGPGQVQMDDGKEDVPDTKRSNAGHVRGSPSGEGTSN